MLFGFHSGYGQWHASCRRTAEAEGMLLETVSRQVKAVGVKCYINIQTPFWLQHHLRLNVLAYLQPACCKVPGWLTGDDFAALRQPFYPEKLFH